MKQFLLLPILLLASLSLSAQTVNDIPIKDIDVEYVQIVGTSKMFTKKVTVELDFGQETKFFSNKTLRVLDEKGVQVEFNSMIDALNFMSKNGFDFVTAYAITMVPNSNVYHYLLKKRKA